MMVISCYVSEVINTSAGSSDELGHADIVVPKEWAAEMIENDGWDNVEHFKNYYVHDDTMGWYMQALYDGVLLGLHVGIAG